MHYVRFLRAPKLAPAGAGGGSRLQIQLLFTITTDLGDSFLYPEKLLDLQVVASASSAVGTSTWLLSDPGRLYWEPGMRVAKPTIALPFAFERAIQAGARIQICVRASEPSQTADGVARILAMASERPRYRKEAARMGAVMPAWVSLNLSGGETDVAMRRLQVTDSPTGFGYVEVEEEIGESIARHVWDAGVVALCAIAGIDTAPDSESSQQPCIRALWNILGSQKTINIMELGCGVGILGVGLGTVFPKLSSSECTILMTDLQEAEARARSNISRLQPEILIPPAQLQVKMLYENLDWEYGREGKFGKEAGSRPWDLVMLSDCTYNVDMLPALVETLSAIHASNLKQMKGEPFTTKVFLATKPRHADEEALFELMDMEGWETLHKQVLLLPVLGADPESVELYLFDKSSYQ